MKKLILLLGIILITSCQKEEIYIPPTDTIDDVSEVVDDVDTTPPPYVAQTIYPTSIQNHQWNKGWYTSIKDFIHYGGTSNVQPGCAFTYIDWDFDGDMDVFAFPEQVVYGNSSVGDWPPPVILQNDGVKNGLIQWKTITGIVPNHIGRAGYRKLTSGDVDNDGDLDLVGFIAEDADEKNGQEIHGGIHLFRFDSETKKFIREDVWPYAAEAAYSFFHGGTLADINNDGWIDIISGGSPKIFLNNGGTFNKDEHIPFPFEHRYSTADAYSIESIDINNDGLADLLVGMSKKPWSQFYEKEYTREDFSKPSEIYINTGEYPYFNTFADIMLDADDGLDFSNLSDSEWLNNTFGVNYDWQVIDFDGDGDLDIFTYLLRDSDTTAMIAYHENQDGEFIPKTKEIFNGNSYKFNTTQLNHQGGLVWIKVWDIDNDGEIEILFDNETPEGKNAYKKINGKYSKTKISNIYNTN